MIRMLRGFVPVYVLLIVGISSGCKFSPFAQDDSLGVQGTTVANGFKSLEVRAQSAAQNQNQGDKSLLALKNSLDKPAFSCVTLAEQDRLSCTEYFHSFAVGNKKIDSCESLNSLLSPAGKLQVVAVAQCQPAEAVKGCLVADHMGLAKKIWWYPNSAHEVRYCASVHKGVVVDAKRP